MSVHARRYSAGILIVLVFSVARPGLGTQAHHAREPAMTANTSWKHLPLAVLLTTPAIVLSACEDQSLLPLAPVDAPPFSTGSSVAVDADSYVLEDSPDAFSGGVDDGLFVCIGPEPGCEMRSLVRFDQNAIAATLGSASLDSAILTMPVIETGVASSAWVAANRMTQAWTEAGATWNCADDPANPNTTECNPADGWDMDVQANWPFVSAATDSFQIVGVEQYEEFTFDVTADVQAFVAGTTANHGWLLRIVAGSAGDLGVMWASESTHPQANPPSLELFLSTPGVSAVTAEQDGFIRSYAEDLPDGGTQSLRVLSDEEEVGFNRTLVRFNQTAISAALGGAVLDSAILEMAFNQSDKEGTLYLGAHRLTQSWVEAGATWNCADDPLDHNTTECDPADVWDMDVEANWPFVATPTDSVEIMDGLTSGVYALNVTSDVQAFVAGAATNEGWMLKGTAGSTGFAFVQMWSREGVGSGAVAPTLMLYSGATQDTTKPVVPAQPAYPSTPLFTTEPGGGTVIRNAMHVRWDDSTSGQTVRAFLAKYGASVIGGLALTGTYVLEIPDPGPTVSDLVAVIQAMMLEPGVKRVYEVTGVRDVQLSGRYPHDGSAAGATRIDWFGAPNDYTRSRIAIRAPLAWGCETGTYTSRRVRAATADLLFSTQQSDLSSISSRWNQPAVTLDTINNKPHLMRHGTGVTSIFGANGDDSTGIAGLIWGSDLRVYPVSKDSMGGLYSTTPAWAFHAMMLGSTLDTVPIVFSSYLADRAYGVTGLKQQFIDDLVDFLTDYLTVPSNVFIQSVNNRAMTRTIPFLASGGAVSDSLTIVEVAVARLIQQQPQLRAQLIIVTATDTTGQIASFADDWGSEIDIAAPGQDIRMLDYPTGTLPASGTSYALPLVAGVAALLRAMDSTLTGAEVKQYILDGAKSTRINSSTGVDSVPESIGIAGIYQLDAYGALKELSGDPSRTNPLPPVCGYPVAAFNFNSIRLERPLDTITRSTGAIGAPTGIGVNHGGRTIWVVGNPVPPNPRVRGVWTHANNFNLTSTIADTARFVAFTEQDSFLGYQQDLTSGHYTYSKNGTLFTPTGYAPSGPTVRNNAAFNPDGQTWGFVGQNETGGCDDTVKIRLLPNGSGSAADLECFTAGGFAEYLTWNHSGSAFYYLEPSLPQEVRRWTPALGSAPGTTIGPTHTSPIAIEFVMPGDSLAVVTRFLMTGGCERRYLNLQTGALVGSDLGGCPDVHQVFFDGQGYRPPTPEDVREIMRYAGRSRGN